MGTCKEGPREHCGQNQPEGSILARIQGLRRRGATAGEMQPGPGRGGLPAGVACIW